MSPMQVTVLGGGSWGTTVASVIAPRHPTLLWARSPETADEIDGKHTNEAYLPGFTLPEMLMATDDLEKAMRHAELLIVGVPTTAMRSTLAAAKEWIHPWIPVVSLAKGLEQGTLLRMTEVIAEVLPRSPGRRPHRPEHRPRDHGRPGGRQRDRHRGPVRRPGDPARAHPRHVPHLHQPRRHRLRARRGAEERRRHRLRHRPGSRRRRQHPRDGDDPRPGRADPARRGDGRRGGDVRRAGRDGRPRDDVHQPVQPQPHASASSSVSAARSTRSRRR